MGPVWFSVPSLPSKYDQISNVYQQSITLLQGVSRGIINILGGGSMDYSE
jgi:hypothetical protein